MVDAAATFAASRAPNVNAVAISLALERVNLSPRQTTKQSRKGRRNDLEYRGNHSETVAARLTRSCSASILRRLGLCATSERIDR
jgi:hypothetical protein